jgi:hypothetical protein
MEFFLSTHKEIHIHPVVVFGAQHRYINPQWKITPKHHYSLYRSGKWYSVQECLQKPPLCTTPSFIVAKNFSDGISSSELWTVLRNSGHGERDYSKCARPQSCYCENRRYYRGLHLGLLLAAQTSGCLLGTNGIGFRWARQKYPRERESTRGSHSLWRRKRRLKQSQGGERVEIENSPIWTAQDHEMDHDICPTNPAGSSNAVQ